MSRLLRAAVTLAALGLIGGVAPVRVRNISTKTSSGAATRGTNRSGSNPISSEKYAWLNDILAVGIGHRFADGPIYNLFELL